MIANCQFQHQDHELYCKVDDGWKNVQWREARITYWLLMKATTYLDAKIHGSRPRIPRRRESWFPILRTSTQKHLRCHGVPFWSSAFAMISFLKRRRENIYIYIYIYNYIYCFKGISGCCSEYYGMTCRFVFCRRPPRLKMNLFSIAYN